MTKFFWQKIIKTTFTFASLIFLSAISIVTGSFILLVISTEDAILKPDSGKINFLQNWTLKNEYLLEEIINHKSLEQMKKISLQKIFSQDKKIPFLGKK